MLEIVIEKLPLVIRLLHNFEIHLHTGQLFIIYYFAYRKTSNTRRTLVGNKTVDHSDVVGASPVGAAPTTSSFST